MSSKNNTGTFCVKVPSAKYIIAPLVFALYALAENKIFLRVRSENLGKGIRIVHISDLHKKKSEYTVKKLCRKVKEKKPDLIFITGDVVSRTEKDFSTVEFILSELCKVAPVYMIFGNHEQSLPHEMKRDFINTVRKTDVILLRNEKARKEINGCVLNIYGLMEKYTTYRKKDGYSNLDKISPDDMEDMLGRCPENNVILLAHNPLFCHSYSAWGAEYTFSGHIHGGCIRLFGRGILSPERKLFPVFSKGVYDVGRMKLLVSGGVGKFRLFNPPEIVAYDINFSDRKTQTV